jgi:hypothetical protein
MSKFKLTNSKIMKKTPNFMKKCLGVLSENRPKMKFLIFFMLLSLFELSANTRSNSSMIPLKTDKIDTQQIVSGLVTDEAGVPLPGANVVEKGTTNGVMADFDGKFSMNLSNANATLIVSFIGYNSKEVPLNGQTSLSIDNFKPTDPALINKLKAEVRVLRAYCYINLAILYGDVPLSTSELTLQESLDLTRTPVGQIWDFIAAELTDASSSLPTVQSDKGRITKGAALGLKARAMLYSGRYTEAAAAAKEVMDLGVYSLYPSYENLFTYAAQNSSEVILDRQFTQNVNFSNIYDITTPNSLWPQRNDLVPTKRGVDYYKMASGKDITDPTSSFDPYDPYTGRDPRLAHSIFTLGSVLPNGLIYDPRPNSGTGDAIGSSENSTYSGFNVKKYLNPEDSSDPNNCGINLILLRYADVLLMYAEAKIEANNIDQSVLDAINEVRARPDVNMPAISGVLDQTTLRQIVRDERVVELAFEGLRYFDIRRWRIAEDLTGIIYGMTYVDEGGQLSTIALTGFDVSFNKDRDYLWPIPFNELVLNPNLTQNPGW